jgi:hypothetical protein
MVRALIRAHPFFEKWGIQIKDFCQTKITIVVNGTERTVEIRSGEASVRPSLFSFLRVACAREGWERG